MTHDWTMKTVTMNHDEYFKFQGELSRYKIDKARIIRNSRAAHKSANYWYEQYELMRGYKKVLEDLIKNGIISAS